MADYPFDRGLIIRANGDPVEAGFVATFHETPDGPAVPTKAMDLSTGHTITTNSHGIFEPFHAPAPSGYLKCAGIIQPVRSTSGEALRPKSVERIRTAMSAALSIRMRLRMLWRRCMSVLSVGEIKMARSGFSSKHL